MLVVVVSALCLLSASFGQAAISPRLTADGFDEVRIGMTATALKRLGYRDIDAATGGDDCALYARPGEKKVWVMVSNGHVSRVTIETARFTTDKGLAVGATESQVRAAYGKGLKAEDNAYRAAPARYLTYWQGAGRGIRYETDEHRKVVTIHGGDKSITYIENCL